MNLIGLIVTGHGVHDEVNPRSEGIFTLHRVWRNRGKKRTVVIVDCPCAGKIIAGDQKIQMNVVGMPTVELYH